MIATEGTKEEFVKKLVDKLTDRIKEDSASFGTLGTVFDCENQEAQKAVIELMEGNGYKVKALNKRFLLIEWKEVLNEDSPAFLAYHNAICAEMRKEIDREIEFSTYKGNSSVTVCFDLGSYPQCILDEYIKRGYEVYVSDFKEHKYGVKKIKFKLSKR